MLQLFGLDHKIQWEALELIRKILTVKSKYSYTLDSLKTFNCFSNRFIIYLCNNIHYSC